MYHEIITTIIWINIHDLIDDITRSQNKSNFEIHISPSIFELQPRSKAQNVGNGHGYLSGIFSFRYNFRQKKFVWSSKWRPFWKFWNMKHSFNWTSYMKISSQIMPKKLFHDDDVIDDVTEWPQSRPPIFLYIWNNNIFMITKQRAKISSSNFQSICIMRL